LIDKIGNDLLFEMNIGFNPQIYPAKTSPLHKSEIIFRSNLIFQQFFAAQNHYIQEEIAVDIISDCSICQTHKLDDILVYPFKCNPSSLSFFLDSLNSDEQIFAFSSCFHSFHLSCLSSAKKFVHNAEHLLIIYFT
jgi:hypothetical protein